MKVRVTLMTENDVPASKLGPDAPKLARQAWEVFVGLINRLGKDKAYIESVEVLED